jgi:hypothetical protein
MSTEQATTRANTSWLLRTAVAGVLLLAAGAFVLSYSALHAVAAAAGINPHLAGLYPLIIDGFITIASLAALHLNNHGPRVTWYPWSLLGGFFTVSVWCNALHAASRTGDVVLSGGTAALVSAMPPVALGLAIHLLILMLRPTRATSRDAAVSTAAGVEASTRQTLTSPSAARRHMNGHDTAEASTSMAPSASASHARRTHRRPVMNHDDLPDRAAAAIREAQRTGAELTGAELGRRLGVSTRHGRRLLHNLERERISADGDTGL